MTCRVEQLSSCGSPKLGGDEEDMQSEQQSSRNGCSLRLCPTPRGEARTLITHHIGVDVCMARQRDFYHKCHRCVYRGKAASFVAPGAEVAADQPVAGRR